MGSATSRVVIAFLAASAFVGAAHGQDHAARDGLLVSAEWLAEHLDDEHLVLLHVGDEETYQSEHIPGARYISLRDVSAPRSEDALALELLPPDQLREVLQDFGISDDSRIIVYFGDDWVTPSTRIMLVLHYAGLGGRSSILDGGMQAWKAEGYEVHDAVVEPRVGRLSPLRTIDLVVDAEFVQEHADADGYALVDGRAAVFYDGVRETHAGTGHIPGAGSVPFTEVVDEALRLRSPDQLRDLFAQAGVREGDTVVAYCHIGQQATAVLFAARVLGYDYRLYDGSMDDWGRRELPLVTPGNE